MSRAFIAGGVLSLVLLAGAGCPAQKSAVSPADDTTKPKTDIGVKDADDSAVDTVAPAETDESLNENPDTTTAEAGDLSLTASALGGQEVKLTWTAPEGLNEDNRFIIVRDELKDPEHTGKNFWIRQHNSKREVVWGSVPTGTMHFRICLTEDDEKDVCAKYSNDAEVEVK